MRIALVSPYDLSVPGGVQGQVIGLAGALAARGDTVTVIAPGETAHEVTGVKVVPVGRTLAVPVNGSRAPVAVSLGAMRRSLAALSAARVQLAHVHEPLVPGPALAVTARGRLPVVGTFHRARAGVGYFLYGHAMARLVRRLDDRVAVSEVAANTLRTAVGPVEIAVLANAVDPGRFSRAVPLKPSAPTALFVGRIERRKGLEVLLEAFSGLAGDFALRVVGDGPDAASLRRRFGGDGRISWLGRLSDDGRDAELAGADLFVAPSLGGESFGVVVLEAMAAGTAVLASDLPGYLVAGGEAAAYCPAGNVRALRDRLGSLLFDSAERRRLASAGRKRAAAHTFGHLAAAYADRYAAVLAGTGGLGDGENTTRRLDP